MRGGGRSRICGGVFADMEIRGESRLTIPEVAVTAAEKESPQAVLSLNRLTIPEVAVTAARILIRPAEDARPPHDS